MGEHLKKLRDQTKDQEAKVTREATKPELESALKELKIVRGQVIRDYEKHSLADLVANSIDIAMEIMKQRGITGEVRHHWEYYIEFYNCCRFEEYANIVAPDARSRILDLHSHQSAYEKLKATTIEDYERATLYAAKAKKEDILQFWNEYIENRALETK